MRPVEAGQAKSTCHASEPKAYGPGLPPNFSLGRPGNSVWHGFSTQEASLLHKAFSAWEEPENPSCTSSVAEQGSESGGFVTDDPLPSLDETFLGQVSSPEKHGSHPPPPSFMLACPLWRSRLATGFGSCSHHVPYTLQPFGISEYGVISYWEPQGARLRHVETRRIRCSVSLLVQSDSRHCFSRNAPTSDSCEEFATFPTLPSGQTLPT